MIAYVEANGHYETIIFYMYFLFSQGLKADIFMDGDTIENKLSITNKKLFKNSFKLLPIRQFLWKAKNYNVILVGTADYLAGGVNKVVAQYIDKTIAIYHTKKYIRDRFKKILVYTPACLVDDRTKYILPINNINNKPNYKDRKELTTKIMFIGQHKYKDLDSIKKCLEYIENSNVILHYFNRSEKIDLYSNNLIQHIGLTDDQMNTYINVMDFITIFPIKNGQYHNQTMSGTIPLAFNNNKPLIIDKQMNSLFNFTSVILYQDSIIEILDTISKMSSIDYNNIITNVYNEKLLLIDNGWKNLDSYLKMYDIKYNYKSPI
jgi:hypothetical protein